MFLVPIEAPESFRRFFNTALNLNTLATLTTWSKKFKSSRPFPFVFSIFLLLWALRTIQYRPCVNIQGGIVANYFGRIGVSATVLVGALFLSSTTPDHLGNGMDMTLTMTGAGFDRTTIVELLDSGGAT